VYDDWVFPDDMDSLRFYILGRISICSPLSLLVSIGKEVLILITYLNKCFNQAIDQSIKMHTLANSWQRLTFSVALVAAGSCLKKNSEIILFSDCSIDFRFSNPDLSSFRVDHSMLWKPHYGLAALLLGRILTNTHALWANRQGRA